MGVIGDALEEMFNKEGNQMETTPDQTVLNIAQPKVTVGFERVVSIRPYETAKASVFIQADTQVGQTPAEMEQALRDAFFQAKAQVFEQLGLEFEINEHGVVIELLKKAFGPVEITSGPATDPYAKGDANDGDRVYNGDTDDDLKCKQHPHARVWDNRPKKLSGEYKSNAPDGKCSECKRGIWLTPFQPR